MGRPGVAQWVTFGALLLLSAALVIGTFSPLWKPLFVAAVLAGALSDWHERLAAKLQGRRGVSSLIFTLVVVLLILVPLATVLTVAVSEMLSAIQWIRATFEAGGIQELIARLPGGLQRLARQIFELLEGDPAGLSMDLAGGGATAVAALQSTFSATGTLVLDAALMLIALKVFLSDGHRLIGWLEEISPLRGRLTAELLREFRATSRSALGSMSASAAIQGVVGVIGYLIAGVPQPVFFGLLTFVAAFVPLVGTALVSVPLAAALFLLGRTGAAIFLLVWSIVALGLVDNVVKPMLLKGAMRIHGAMVFFSLVGGLLLFGPVGVVAGPLSVTFLLTMIRVGQRDFAGRGPADPDPAPPQP